MTIKQIIQKEAREMIEATTVRIGGENIEIADGDIKVMKDNVERTLETLASNIRGSSSGKIKREESEKMAKTFMRNYLKGVYGK